MTKLVKQLRSKYNSGRIIQDSEWEIIDGLIKKASEISNKEDYLRKNASIDRFKGLEIEDFEVMVKQNSIFTSLVIDLEDIFSCILNKDFEIFSSVEEAKKQLTKSLEKISELKKEYNEYFNEEL